MARLLISRRGLVLGSGAGLVAAAAGIRPAHAQSTLERVREQGFIRIGFANEAPYGYATPSGELTGEAPEVAKAVLERMGIAEVDGVLTEFASLIPGLKAGRFDIIAAGMFVSPKRCEQIAFSEPTYGMGQAFLVAEGNPKGVKTYDDFANDSDLRLGVMAGAIEKQFAEDSGVDMSKVQTYPDGPSALAAVRAGRIDGFPLTSLSINNLVKTAGEGSGVEATPSFSEIAGSYVRGHGAFGFRKEDQALLDAFNAQLKEFIGSEDHLALVEPFGFDKNTLPEKTTEELCAG
ncbi:ectoine/hydroxyectoine ABC transporter substrate-binding protein EhuB [Geminicoccaceae bacterium 1502E]|nr:ectoine/hydroxyectoine ABC transporter substrate-binding protein EhuB [Geminicoccaceae bacterium 1502E]